MNTKGETQYSYLKEASNKVNQWKQGKKELIFRYFIFLFAFGFPMVSASAGPDPSLVGHWTFDNIVGSTVVDDSGNGNDGAIIGGAVTDPNGIIGSAMVLDGIDDYVEIPNASSIDLTDDFTLSAWVQFDTVGATPFSSVITKVIAFFRKQYMLGSQGNQLCFDYGSSIVCDSDPVPVGTWIHIAATLDSSLAIAKVYLDGVEVARQTNAVPATSEPAPVRIGFNPIGIQHFVDGKVDDVRIYDRPLSHAEIAKLVNEVSPSVPVTDLISVSGIPAAIPVGETFNVTVFAANLGTTAGLNSAMNASLLFTDGTNASDLEVSLPTPNPSWSNYNIVRKPGETIFDRDCQPISGGAIDYLVESGITNKVWDNGDINAITFSVTPLRSGTLRLRFRSTLRIINGNPCDFVNDTSVSGGTTVIDQQGWKTIQFSVEVVELPVPDLLSVDGIPDIIGYDDSFTIAVQAANTQGTAGTDSAINASVLYDDGTEIGDVDITGLDTFPPNWQSYLIVREPGQTIFNNQCLSIPGGAIDYLVEAGISGPTWNEGEINELSFTVTPLRTGTLNLRFRTTFRAGTLGCEFVNDITACDGVPVFDQQGWQAMEFTTLVAIPGDANLDGCVDNLDVQILQNNWNQSGNVTWEDGDFNGDGFIGIDDFNQLAIHFGEGC